LFIKKTKSSAISTQTLEQGVSLGKTYLHAEIISTDSPSSEKVVFGRDSIEVSHSPFKFEVELILI